jgi:hypothetical protein
VRPEPRTDLGRRLASLREAIVASGRPLLDEDGVLHEASGAEPRPLTPEGRAEIRRCCVDTGCTCAAARLLVERDALAARLERVAVALREALAALSD